MIFIFKLSKSYNNIHSNLARKRYGMNILSENHKLVPLGKVEISFLSKCARLIIFMFLGER